MSALERIRAVLRREKLARAPFVPNEDLIPRGEAERHLRERGMGLCLASCATAWSAWPNCATFTKRQGDAVLVTWRTPAGTVSRRRVCRPGPDSTAQAHTWLESWIKTEQDFGPVIAMLDDETFYPDPLAHDYARRDLGQDGVVKVAGILAPLEASYVYFDNGSVEGYEKWMRAQSEHPGPFARLLAALEAREERRLQAIKDSPGEVMSLPGIGKCSAAQFEQQTLPFLRRVIPLLKRPGLSLALEIEAASIRAFRDLIPQTGVDVVSGLIPPPYGDLSLREARAAWGDQLVIWVSFPSQVFWQGAEATRRYTLELLESDPGGPLVLGMTSLWRPMDEDDETAAIVGAGLSAVLDAIEGFSAGGSI